MAPPVRYALDSLLPAHGTLSEPDHLRMRQALAAAVAEQPPADADAMLPAEAVRLLATVGRSLTGERPRWGAVMALVEDAPEPLRNRMPLRLLWLRAAGRVGRGDEIVPEITRLLALEPADHQRDAALMRLALQMGLAHRLPGLPRLFPLRWGEPKATITETLAALDTRPTRAKLPPALLSYLCQLRGIAPDAVEDFTNRLAWTVAARDFMTALGIAEGHILKQEGQANTATDARVLDLARQFTATFRAWDFSMLERLRDQGRSILLLGSHLGTVEPRGGDLLPLQMRIALVRAGVPVNDHAHALKDVADAIVIATANASSLPFDLLKLAKTLRSEQFLIRIFPDGGQGGSLREIDLDGWRIKLGTGAAMLGYHAKAQVVFSRSRWTGRHWAFDPQLGPDLAKARSLDEADDLVTAFYTESLLAVLRGPVEDIGGVSGTIAPYVG